MQNNHLSKSKKGVASLYVVIFATILFGVITLSFVRVILTESTRSTDDDLSQSAYDSALAGVEDAKRAVKKYYNSGDDNGLLFSGGCNEGVNRILRGTADTGEVKLSSSVSNDTEQAYTCVKISRITPDYRATVSSDTRTRIVPLGINTSALGDVDAIEFSWFTNTNDIKYQGLNYPGFTSAPTSPIPPVISLTIVSMGGEEYVPPASVTSPDGNFDEFRGVNTTVVLYPESRTRCEEIKNHILAGDDEEQPCYGEKLSLDASAAGNVGGDTHIPYRIECANEDEHTEFACTASIGISGRFMRDKDSAFLVVSLPYGDEITAFNVKLKRGSGSTSEIVMFDGAQISIDSTGRANDLLRRVETRVDISDVYFPVPQFALNLGSSDEESLEKARWVTANCWTEKGKCDNNGKIPDDELNDGKDSDALDSEDPSESLGSGTFIDEEVWKKLLEDLMSGKFPRR